MSHDEAQRLIIATRSIDDQTGCWNWTGAIDKDGYGRCSKVRWGHWGAHRLAYQSFIGPIEGNLQIDHLCRNRRCVNPAHLEQVTFKENVLRGISFSAENARKTHCINGHPFAENNLYTQGGKRRHCRKCNLARVKRYQAKIEQLGGHT